MTDPDYSGLPDELSVLVTRHWQRFQEVGHVLPDALLKDLPRVWAGSDYVAEQFIRDADLGDWLAGCALKARLEPGRLGEEISQAVMACDDEDALKATLRRLRHRHVEVFNIEIFREIRVVAKRLLVRACAQAYATLRHVLN